MEALESVLGYSFRDSRLLTMALTHGSVGYEAQRAHADNQRLEFLGDAVLQLMVSELLYQTLPKADEGELTKLRSQVVSTKALAAVARRLKLGGFLIMGRGEAANGGRERENTLADAMEAVTGALYLDGGLLEAQRLIQRLFNDELERLLVNPGDQNPKGQLQEILQAVAAVPPQYAIIQETGPDHAKSFEATVQWLGGILGKGSGSSKKEAEIDSARDALKQPALDSALKALAAAHFKATEKAVKKCEQPTDKSGQPCEQLS